MDQLNTKVVKKAGVRVFSVSEAYPLHLFTELCLQHFPELGEADIERLHTYRFVIREGSEECISCDPEVVYCY